MTWYRSAACRHHTTYDLPGNDTSLQSTPHDTSTTGNNDNKDAANVSWPASWSIWHHITWLLLSTQRTMPVNNSFQLLHTVYNSQQHVWCNDGHSQLTTAMIWFQSQTGGCINIWTYFLFAIRLYPRVMSGNNRISSANFCALSHNKYGSILFNYDHGTDNGWQTDDRRTKVCKHCISDA